MPRKKRGLRPSSKSTPSCSKTTKRKEIMTACMKIHGGTVLKKEPILHGTLDTLTSQLTIKNKGINWKNSYYQGLFNKKY